MVEEEQIIVLEKQQTVSKVRFKRRIREKKHLLNSFFVADHRWFFRCLDVAVLLMIVFNVGALVLTNMLVVKEKPTVVFQEANPVIAEVHGWQYGIGGATVMSIFLVRCLMWAALISVYVFFRRRIYSYEGMMLLGFIVLFYLVATSLDFFNNFGYFLGRTIYGG